MHIYHILVNFVIMAGIYIHIPFCKKRCIYCDFYSTTNNQLADSYIDCLCNELSLRIHEIEAENVTTIYIGGGTPSQLSNVQLTRLVNYVKTVIDFNKITEFTIEVNPDDINTEYMQLCRSLGINRVSMGIQSFIDTELEIINRRHNSQQALDAVNIIKSCGFSNISIDLIYGLPLQTLDSWKESVKTAISLDVPHISSYNLSYEEGTVLYQKRENGEINECNEDDCIKMYEILVSELKNAGYVHYEISNFAKPNCYSQHNTNYWNLTPYLGIGASAHSFDGKTRRYNPASIHEYMTTLKYNNVAYEEETETSWEKYNEYVMINLRTMWGVNLGKLKNAFGDVLYNYLIKNSRKFITNDMMKIENDNLIVTEKGVMLSDLIIRTLIYVP